MNCATCKANKIGPNTAPYGGYMCSSEHLQCRDCNALAQGQCGVCENSTNFVQMNYNNQSTTLTSPVPTAPPLDADSNFGLSEQNTSNIFPKDFFATIETQSNISQEQLSMQESHVSEHGLAEQPQPQSPMQSQTQHQQMQPMPQTSIAGQQEADRLDLAELKRRRELLSKHSSQIRDEHSALQLDSSRTQTAEPVHAAPSKQPIQHKASVESRVNSLSMHDGKLKASKGMFEDIDDSNVIHTSEIRFMESTESLKNYYSGGTAHPSLKSRPEHAPHSSQQESLSMRVLHDFESQNTAQPSELVENYLRSYGPLALCHFPVYSINHNCSHGSCESWTAQQRLAHMRSICVSTESEPNLAGNCPHAKVEMPGKYLPPEFFVMQATGVAEPALGTIPETDKTSRPSIDIRMQKVLETFQEDPRQPNVSEKPLLDQTKNFVKIPVTELQVPQGPPLVIEVPEVPEVEPASANESAEKANLDIATRLSNSHRAYYNPPPGRASAICTPTSMEPKPQFQLITCSTLVTNELTLAKARYLNMRPIPANQLTIPRAPIQCPESSCCRMIFVSDFNKHLIVDHSKLPMERIATRQCKNFFLDPRLSHNGVSKCHLLYLIRDKVTDLGSGKFKDFLPLLVMTSRIKLSELCGIAEADRHRMAKSDVEFLMIWLTGIVPEEFPVSISLTVWPRSGLVPTSHMVHSGEMYSIRKSQHVANVCASGQRLLLSAPEVQLLTNSGRDMLELQLVVH